MIVTLPIDAVPTGNLRLYHDVSRNAGYSEVPLVAQSPGVFDADVSGFTGRFYPSALYTIGTVEHRLDMAYVDLPLDTGLVVTPESLAVKAKMTLPLDAEQRETIIDAILDAQADVTAYLGRAIVPTTYVQTGCYPFGDGWNLTAHGDDDIIEVTNVEPEVDPDGQTTGYFTITYLAGLDARTDPTLRPIARYVRAHAMNSPDFTSMWRTATGIEGEVRSVSAEGQSVSFTPATLGGGGDAGSGKPGALPTLASLDRWRVAGRRVHQGRTRAGEWPYSGAVWSL